MLDGHSDNHLTVINKTKHTYNQQHKNPNTNRSRNWTEWN